MGVLLSIGLGGFVGAILRYLVSGLVHRLSNGVQFPLGTLAVNLFGCLLIGILAGVAESRGAFGPELRAFMLIGMLGAFTTFSTFGYETLAFLRDGQSVLGLVNVALNVLLGVSGVWVGLVLVKGMWR